MALDHQGSGETPDEQYPYVLITGRIREHYNNGSMTRRSLGISDVAPEELAEISFTDAASLGINNSDWIRFSSRPASQGAHQSLRAQSVRQCFHELPSPERFNQHPHIWFSRPYHRDAGI
ncbi:MAG: hypothetical protein F9K32_02620 [Desulfobulbaceae bacterium]|nr:MAG: hypothetical protein F9K32_02620 [Desulfobulbaceae bacterium]